MKSVLGFLLLALSSLAQSVPNIADVQLCPNYPSGRPPLSQQPNSGDLRKIVITAPNALCNDGTRPVMYVRAAKPGASEPAGPSANRWVIHLEGGGSCESYEDCGVRWCGIGFYTAAKMSGTPQPDLLNVDGLFSRNSSNWLADRNQVLVNYCSSDEWQGRNSNVVLRSTTDPSRAFSLHYQGANILSAALDALERGVTGMPKLTDATDVLLSGDSGGSKGVRSHLDRVSQRLKSANPNTRVLGMLEASFHPDVNGKQGFPAGDSRDPVAAPKIAEFNRTHIALRNAQLDDSCLAAHPGTAAFLCADNGYLELNHITTPFFQLMDITDPNLAGIAEGTADPNITLAAVAQRTYDQIGELANIKATALERAAITTAPGASARNCGVHVMWSSDDGFFGKKIRSAPGATAYSFFDLLTNWMTNTQPFNVRTPRPPDSPAEPEIDPACTAKAPNTPAVNIATVSSASYDPLVAPEAIVTTFGVNLASSTALATAIPYPTILGGVAITVTDSANTARPAPVYFVSPSQVSYLIPAGTRPGLAKVQIGTQQTTVQVAATAPGIYSANSRGTGVAAATYIRIAANGARSEGLLFNPNTKADTGVVAAPGDQIYLILYGTGMRGGPATATIETVQVPIAGPVAHSQFPGLDQINLGPLPTRVGYGRKQIIIRQGDAVANTVTVTFRQP